ncbi:hypothetical protein Goari_002305, partial [Gossypium aridum]|nr:hypothetical protein [Gossypium aridum]
MLQVWKWRRMHEEFPTTEERICNIEKEAWSLFS